MISKLIEKEKVLKLRKEGKSYSEILKLVPVAKSSVSLWLKDVGLSKSQKQRITKKRIDAAYRGGEIRKLDRLQRSKDIFLKAKKEIGEISKRELWLIGIGLYWAEGSKEKETRPGSGVDFTNSDPHMISLFIYWLDKVFGIKKENLTLEIYIHQTYAYRIEGVKRFWSKITNFPLNNFSCVHYKKHNPQTIRKNIGNMYNGNLRIRVKASSILLRKITGWIRGVYKDKYWEIV